METEPTTTNNPPAQAPGTSPADAQEAAAKAAAAEVGVARQRLARVGRNEPCPCGSGRKYKKCCLAKDEAVVLRAAESERKAAAEAERAATTEAAAAERARQAACASKWESTAEREDEAEEAWEGNRLFNSHTEPVEGMPPEVDKELERLWDEFQKLEQPSGAEMDRLLDKLLALPPESTVWYEVLHTFAREGHPDLPGVFRRIANSVPHTKATDLSYFYWAAVEEFDHRGLRQLLPEVALGLRRLERCQAESLQHIEYYLLADGFEAEALAMDEYFLPRMRQDEEFSYAAYDLAERILQLRLGRLLPEQLGAETPVESLARELCAGLEEEEFNFEAVRFLVAVAAGQALNEPWSRELFEFKVKAARKQKQESPPLEAFRLSGVALRVAQEACRREGFSPGCGFVALSLMLDSVEYQRAKPGKKPGKSLLDYLGAADLEERVASSCRDLMSINVPMARLVLQGYELLLHLALRQQLVPPGQAAETDKKLAELQGKLRASA